MRDSVENLQMSPQEGPLKVMEAAGRRQRKGLAQALGAAPLAIPAANLHQQSFLNTWYGYTRGTFAFVVRLHPFPPSLGKAELCLFLRVVYVFEMSLILKRSNHCHAASEPLGNSVFLLK